mgnify:CR=1 FL=1
MKKILSIILCLVPVASFATSMCVEDDTVAVVLDASQDSIGATGGNLNVGNANWNITFPWGKIYGVGACVSSNKGDVVTNLTDTINGVEQEIVGGETNGNYCYLKIIHPVSSGWTYITGHNSCSGVCVNASYTFDGVRILGTSLLVRQRMFSSVE